MPEDCADAMNASSKTQPQSHDPDCQGCRDCPATASVKAPALGFASAATVDAPNVITVEMKLSSVGDFGRQPRHRPTPLAHGPPPAATPVNLNDVLLI